MALNSDYRTGDLRQILLTNTIVSLTLLVPFNRCRSTKSKLVMGAIIVVVLLMQNT